MRGRGDRQKRTARERIERLFEQAEKEFPEHKERSNRYVELARTIGIKYKVRIPKKLKRKFCKYCYSFIKPGINCLVRKDPGNEKLLICRCEECGKEFRIPCSKESK